MLLFLFGHFNDMAGVRGIEPLQAGLESAVLPLY